MENHNNDIQKSRPSISQESNLRDIRSEFRRDRRPDADSNGDESSYNARGNSRDIGNRNDQTSGQSMQQASTFGSFNYNTSDHLLFDISRPALSMMSTYNMIPWTVNSMAMNQHISVNQSQPATPMVAGMDPYAYMGGENMYDIVGMGNYCQFGGMAAQGNMFLPQVKEVVQLSNSVLYPPSLEAPQPTTRERPLGCKTIFVGGLPEKITEEIIKEIFERYGTVETIRMSKKNFCHVRFSDEVCVDNALYFSGYRLKIENKDESAFTGRLHVDYAQARDDEYDYECKQRALARHQEQDYYRPPTPPVVHYTDHEASLICEKLKNEETFAHAANILITWLDKGECTKENASIFFSMIQSTHSHVRKLLLDKMKYEEQLNDAKVLLKKQLEGIIHQFTEIEKIYKAASSQKSWDQFTKAQQKNMEMWKKQTEELKNAHLEEVIGEDEEMELSDDENDENKNCDNNQLESRHEDSLNKLQDENDSLRHRIKTVKDEIMIIQLNHQEEIRRRDTRMGIVRQALQNSQKEVLNLRQKNSKNEEKLKELRAFQLRMRYDHLNEDNDSAFDNNVHLRSNNSTNVNLENEARLIGLISAFLHVNPFGANINYICSYLHQTDSSVTVGGIENLLKRYPGIFREDSTGIGASLIKKWHFIGFAG